MVAATEVPITTIIGMGGFISAIIGATKVMKRARMLQIPRVLEAKLTGKMKLARYMTPNTPPSPAFVITIKKGTSEGWFFCRSMMQVAPIVATI